MMDLVNFQKYQFLLSANGREAIKSEIRVFRERYGEDWRKEFVEDFPDFAEIVSLVANFEADSAFVRLRQIIEQKIDNEIDSAIWRTAAKTAAMTFLDNNRAEVFKLHAELSEEIHRKQF